MYADMETSLYDDMVTWSLDRDLAWMIACEVTDYWARLLETDEGNLVSPTLLESYIADILRMYREVFISLEPAAVLEYSSFKTDPNYIIVVRGRICECCVAIC